MQNVHAQRLTHILKRLDLETGGREVGDSALKALRMNRSLLNTPDFTVSPEQEVTFIDFGCETLNDNCFATRAGLNFHEVKTLNAYIAKYSQSLREAIENSARYYSILDSSFALDLRISSNSASFGLTCLDPEIARHHRFIEFMGFKVQRILSCSCSTNKWALSCNHFCTLPSRPPGYSARFQRLDCLGALTK